MAHRRFFESLRLVHETPESICAHGGVDPAVGGERPRSRLSRTHGLDAVLAAHTLDAILTPAGSGANMASRAGYPIIAVPFGLVPNEPTLLAIAYAFEQASRKRMAPLDLP